MATQNVSIGTVRAKIATAQGETYVNSISVTLAGVNFKLEDFNMNSKSFDKLCKKLEIKAKKQAVKRG